MAEPHGATQETDAPLRVLLVTKGHPFQREPFFSVFDDDPALDWTHVEHPAANQLIHPDRCRDFDVVAFYDMPGVRFTRADPPMVMSDPSMELRAAWAALVESGKGLVFLHHAIAGWPSWPEYAHIMGGRFHYAPATLAGTAYSSSGYQFDVTHRVSVLDPAHPVCAGLGEGFTLTDELYLLPVLDHDVVPLLRTDAALTDDRFFSADLAIRGERDSRREWSHPPGSDLVGWVKHAGNSPVCYLQFGDGPGTYADPSYRRVLANALRWAASAEARNWAATRRRELGHDGWSTP